MDFSFILSSFVAQDRLRLVALTNRFTQPLTLRLLLPDRRKFSFARHPTQQHKNVDFMAVGCIIVCLTFHPIANGHAQALKGLACRKRVAQAT
jgi:hypothetical protein